MEYEIVSSGSNGNCLIIDKKIMIDIGVPYSKIEDKVDNIKVICITHGHKDHLNITTIRKLKREHPNIKYICGDYLVPKLVSEAHLNKNSIFVLRLANWYDIGLLKVKIDLLYHDVPNVCYHIEYNGKKIFYATDTGRIDHIVAKNYDYYFLEANYDTDSELEEKIQEAQEKGEFSYLKRVKYTHLSQLQALNWLEENQGENSSYIFMHKHKDRGNKVEKGLD